MRAVTITQVVYQEISQKISSTFWCHYLDSDDGSKVEQLKNLKQSGYLKGEVLDRGQSWKRTMYEKYMKDVVPAGIETNGRTESVNVFFNGFVNSSTMFNDFIVQYDSIDLPSQSMRD